MTTHDPKANEADSSGGNRILMTNYHIRVIDLFYRKAIQLELSQAHSQGQNQPELARLIFILESAITLP